MTTLAPHLQAPRSAPPLTTPRERVCLAVVVTEGGTHYTEEGVHTLAPLDSESAADWEAQHLQAARAKARSAGAVVSAVFAFWSDKHPATREAHAEAHEEEGSRGTVE